MFNGIAGMITKQKNLIVLSVLLLRSLEAGNGFSCCSDQTQNQQPSNSNTSEIDGFEPVREQPVDNPLNRRQNAHGHRIHALPCFPCHDIDKYRVLSEILREDDPRVIASWYSVNYLCGLSLWVLENSDVVLVQSIPMKYAWRSAMAHLCASIKQQRIIWANKEQSQHRTQTLIECDSFLRYWREKINALDPQPQQASRNSGRSSRTQTVNSPVSDFDEMQNIPSWISK